MTSLSEFSGPFFGRLLILLLLFGTDKSHGPNTETRAKIVIQRERFQRALVGAEIDFVLKKGEIV
jgi:hypothetical protein